MTSKKHLTDGEWQEARKSEAKHISDFAGKISDLCKYVWAGSLAIFYALITTDPASPANKLVGTHRSLLFVAAIAGALAFLFDYLQYFCAYLHAEFRVKWFDAKEDKGEPITIEENNNRTTSIFSIGNELFFYAKNLAVLVTASLVAYVIVTGFLR